MLNRVEKNVLAALIAMSDKDDKVFNVSNAEIARKMGYKESGGTIPMALELLVYKNRIMIGKQDGKRVIRVLL